MAKEMKIKGGKKVSKKPAGAKVGKGQKPGKLKEGEVEGQGQWVIVNCPWCGGLNRCYDTAAYEVWACAWCGQLFAG